MITSTNGNVTANKGNQPLLPSINNRPVPNFISPDGGRSNSVSSALVDDPVIKGGHRRSNRNGLSLSMDTQHIGGLLKKEPSTARAAAAMLSQPDSYATLAKTA